MATINGIDEAVLHQLPAGSVVFTPGGPMGTLVCPHHGEDRAVGGSACRACFELGKGWIAAVMLGAGVVQVLEVQGVALEALEARVTGEPGGGDAG